MLDITEVCAGESHRFRQLYAGINLTADVDRLTERFHLAVCRAGNIVAIATVGPEPLPQSTYLKAWHISRLVFGCALSDQGLEIHILAVVMRWIRSAGGPFIWAEVPTSARDAFRSLGFTTTDAADCLPGHVRMTCRADGIADFSAAELPADGEIRHILPLPRLSRAVIHQGVVHLSGLLPNRADVSVREQTLEVLEKLDAVMALANTDRSRLISATVYLSCLSGVAEMNAAWEAWLVPHRAPARSCVQAIPGSADYAVEIAAIAAAPRELCSVTRVGV